MPISLDEAAKAIAPLLWSMRSQYVASNDRKMRSYLKKAVDGMCRHLEYFCNAAVSEAALSRAKKNDFDLSKWDWRSQPKFDPDRKHFHFEHVVTAKNIREAVLDAKSEAEVERSLRRTRVAWILKSEDKKLSDSGYRKNRLDPDKAYEDAGIKLIDLV